ncbi:MAG: M48 family metallopeptidase [Syntrophobacterales bacterium]|nr:M48 family metallopeptidase [Syntrophobacterales bacterium]
MKYNASSDLTYELVRSKKRRKTLTIQMRMDGTVSLLVPYRISKREADDFFKEKETWIRKQLVKRVEGTNKENREKKFVAGKNFLYHGETYPLEIGEHDGRASLLALSHGTFILRTGESNRTKEIFADWYQNEARRELTERVRYYGGHTGLIPKGITITGARTRYGSCSPANRLSFSWRIIMAPYPAIDYVILHELAHIKVKNHSPLFWQFLETICPNWKEQMRWLKDNGHRLHL